VFEVGFSELLLVGLVALLVFGPERLPSLARTAGLWIGRGRRFLSTVKADIEQELKAEELKRIIREQQLNNPLHDLIEDTGKSLRDAREQAEAALKPLAASTTPASAALSEPAQAGDPKAVGGAPAGGPGEAGTETPAKPAQ
jgi:sec-independent protein translocase protein TatB